MTKNIWIVGLFASGFMISASGAFATSPVATPSDQLEPAHTVHTTEEHASTEKAMHEGVSASKKESEENKKEKKHKKHHKNHDHKLSKEARNAAKSN